MLDIHAYNSTCAVVMRTSIQVVIFILGKDKLWPEVRIHAEYLSLENLLKFLAPHRPKREGIENDQQIVTGVVIYLRRSHRASFCKADVRYEQIDERDDQTCGRYFSGCK